MKTLFIYLLLLSSSILHAQDIQTGSRIYPDMMDLGTAGWELYENDSSYLALVSGSYLHTIDKQSLDRTEILDLSPFEATDRTGHSLLITDSVFYLAVVSPLVGVVSFDYEGNLLDSFIFNEMTSCTIGDLNNPVPAVWSAGDDEVVFTISFDYCSDLYTIYLDGNLNQNLVLELSLPLAVELQELSVYVPYYFEQINETTFRIGLTSYGILCAGFSCFNIGPAVLAEFSTSGELVDIYTTTTDLGNIIDDIQESRYAPTDNNRCYISFDGNGYQANSEHKIISIDGMGNLEWIFSIEDENFDLISRELTTDASGSAVGLVSLGAKFRFADGIFSDFASSRSILYKISPEGDSIWERTLIDSNYLLPSEESRQELRDLLIDQDGAIVLVGSVELPEDTTQLWVLRLNEMGCLTGSCTEFVLSSVDDLPLALRTAYVPRLQVYPNPAPQQFTVDWPPNVAPEDSRSTGNLRLLDLSGRVVTTQEDVQLPFNWQVPTLPHGQYLLEWQGRNGQMAKGKVWMSQ
ncbi:MAG: T9SS type A sorting domain-containing protein [Bacteroidota bacterium]